MTVPTRDKIDRFHRSTNDNGSHPSRRYHSTIFQRSDCSIYGPMYEPGQTGREGYPEVSAGRRLCCTAEPHRHMTMPWPKKKRKENPLHLRYPRALRAMSTYTGPVFPRSNRMRKHQSVFLEFLPLFRKCKSS